MQHPENIYYLALLLLGLPASLHVGMARVLVAVGAASCLAYVQGLSMPWTYLATHVVACAAGVLCCRCGTRNMLAVSLFVDLIFIDAFEIGGLFTGHDAWWARWWLVNAQLLLLAPEAGESIRRVLRWTMAPTETGDWLKFEPVV